MVMLLILPLFGMAFTGQARAFGTARSLPSSDFTNNVVFRPGPDYTSWGTIYARSLQLPDNSLLLTWENYPPEPPLASFPIWKSTDGGATWSDFFNVTDQVNDWGLRYQPHFYTLEEDLGEYKAGTAVLSGMSVPHDLSEARLDVYTSADNGDSWQFASHIAYAPGPETTQNGDKAVWEPFFVMRDNKLICYYSDQRDANHAQKLVHVTTEDLVNWSDPVNDVAMPDYEARPGMAIVAHIESTDKYVMTYELCGIESDCLAFFKVADSPYNFGGVDGHRVVENTTGEGPGHAPFVIWTPHPDRDDGSGLVLMNGGDSEAIFINEDDVSLNGWKAVGTGQQPSHSRCLEIIDVHGEKKLLMSSAGQMDPNHDNYVSVGVISIPT